MKKDIEILQDSDPKSLNQLSNQILEQLIKYYNSDSTAVDYIDIDLLKTVIDPLKIPINKYAKDFSFKLKVSEENLKNIDEELSKKDAKRYNGFYCFAYMFFIKFFDYLSYFHSDQNIKKEKEKRKKLVYPMEAYEYIGNNNLKIPDNIDYYIQCLDN